MKNHLSKRNMKKYIVCILATILIGSITLGINIKDIHATDGVVIDETNFPDPNFRAVISGPDYDRDGNGILDASEIALTINIYCEGMGITSLKGVEYFTALQGLWCKDNAISTMDLSNNKDLHGVWCSGNLFTSLDFSANPELEWVYCYDCNLTYLNVSNNPKMAFIECNTNPLSSLDVSNCPLLEHLTCGTCNLTSLDLSNNPELSHLDAFSNSLTSLDVSHNPKLKRLDIWNNQGLGSIDVSNNPGLQYYNCAYNDAYTIDVSNNPELNKLICSYNSLTSLDLSGNPKLVYLDCACNSLTSLDLSNNPDLYFLQAFTNSFTTLDISSNPFLIKTYNDGKKKDESAVCQGHSWTIDYGGDTSTGGDNIYFICFDDKVTIKGNTGTGISTATTATVTTLTSDQVSREMVVWTLYNMAGCPDVTGLKSRFTDAESGAWYEDALKWAEDNSIAIGYPYAVSDTFGVGLPVARQDLILMLMRYSEYKNYKRAIDFGRSDYYADYYDIDYYAWEAMCWAMTWNIMTGKGEPGAPKEEQYLYPHVDATPTDMHDMINRMLEVNGLSQISSFPTPDTSGQASVEITVSDNEADLTEEITETEEDINASDPAEDIQSSSYNAAVSEDEATVSGDNIPTENKTSGFPVFIAALIGAIAGVAGYKIFTSKKKKED